MPGSSVYKWRSSGTGRFTGESVAANAQFFTNRSGATVLRGSCVKLDTTADNSFTTSTTLDDTLISGITLEELPNLARGLVAFQGTVERARVAVGATRGQLLRQSTTAGIAEGTAGVTDGSFALALTNRNSDGFVEAMIFAVPRGTPPDTIGGLSIYGDGSDGVVTISSNTTLTADKNYSSLTVNSSIVLSAAGYRIFVSGTLTLTGNISNDGPVGGNGGDANGITAGSAGVAGAAPSAGNLGAAANFPAGKSGRVGGAGINGSANGNPGTAGISGDAVTNSIGGNVGSAGGLGGNGGNGSPAGVGGTGGGASTGGARTATSIAIQNPTNLTLFRLISGTSLLIPSSSGSSGSGGSAGSGGVNNTGRSGAGGGSGASGSNGGPVLVFARIIAGAGNITARGGAGGNGGNGGNAAVDSAGGGGTGGGGAGGDGGIVILVRDTSTWTGSLIVTGGALGVKGATVGTGFPIDGTNGTLGADGVAGLAGYSLQLVNAA